MLLPVKLIRSIKERALLFTVLILLCFSSYSQNDSDQIKSIPSEPVKVKKVIPQSLSTGKSKEWHNREYQLKLLIPADWQNNKPNGREIVSFSTLKREKFSVRAYPGLFQGSIEEIRERLIFAFSYDFPDYTFISSKVKSIGSLPVAEVLYSANVDSTLGFYKVMYFDDGKHSFVATSFYPKSGAEEFEKMLNDIFIAMSFE